MRRKVIEHARMFSATEVIIEDKSSGIQLIQELRDDGLYQVKGYSSTLDKIARMEAQTAQILYGTVLFPRKAPWLECYLDELTMFPMCKYDDQVDSTSQALESLTMMASNMGMFYYYKQLSEELDRKNGIVR